MTCPRPPFPDAVPSQHTMQKVFKHYYRGRGTAEIARKLGLHPSSVKRWMANEGRYHPWVDEVAVERVMAGEAYGTWCAMSVYDRIEVLDRCYRRSLRDPYDIMYNNLKLGNPALHWTVRVGESTVGVSCLRAAIAREAKRRAA